MRAIMLGLVAIAGVGIMSGGAFAKSKPDATVKITGKSVGVGVGVSWGKGTLTYKGKSYPFSVDGLFGSVTPSGWRASPASGTV